MSESDPSILSNLDSGPKNYSLNLAMRALKIWAVPQIFKDIFCLVKIVKMLVESHESSNKGKMSRYRM